MTSTSKSSNAQAIKAVGAAAASQLEHKHTREAPQQHLQVLPLRFTKVIHFVRHGLGFHNVAGRIDHNNYKVGLV